MFALVLTALLVLLALASVAVLADSGLRWWSAFGALKRQLADGDRSCAQAPTTGRRRIADRSPLGSRTLMSKVALRAAA
ncbi:hypothetical protein A9995_12080 [Erythrobacter sp. QSSC1-22B]|uniref:hypothetical protein n=1 Tax=Erythrobacter sp. QSSC1-22B TaxID=1860125 RepID=UPI0008048E07|nr:hypothetical protein [Erythrobacter sp. QSSC1-22B]OBX18235.1 hypothetical protein A9995_12080 [Erythrobacter sp. QSSC1-22B]